MFTDNAFQQELNRTFFKIQKPEINLELLTSQANLTASIRLVEVPGGMFLNGDESNAKEIKWQPDTTTCSLRYGKIPGNRNLVNYPNSISEPGTGQINLNPYHEGITTGIYYCILVSVSDPTQTSVEFKIIVQSDRAPLPSAPKGTINLRKTPEFKWDKVQGVPYYFLFLSEGKMSIKRDDNDKITGLEGLKLTWQVITPDNLVEYGTPDPTGNFFNIFLPPLLPGVDYNWLVLNCYGPSTNFVSGDVAPLAPENFKVTRDELSVKPSPIQPENGSTISDNDISFSWNPVPGVSRYRIFLFETTESFGNTIEYILWSQVTSDTKTRLKAKNLLIKTDYHWRVVAEQGNKISTSDRWQFKYDGSAGWVKFNVKSAEEKLSRVSLKIKNEEGVSLLIPTLTDSNGIKKLGLPSAKYTYRASKTGFLTTDLKGLTVTDNDTIPENVNMVRSATTISGQIVDESELGLFDAIVELKGGNHVEQVNSDVAGYFSTSVNPDNWSLRIRKMGYVSTGFQNIPPLQENEARDVGQRTLKEATNQLQGFVSFVSDGRSLPGAFVRAQQEDIEYATTTDDQGKFIFRLGPGAWKVVLDSQGFFANPNEKTIEFTENQTETVNFQLFSGGLIYGKASFQNLGVAGAEVRVYSKMDGELVQSVKTNIQGNYSLGIRDAGDYLLTLKHEKFLQQRTDITINLGQTIVQDFTLTKAGFVAGTVIHANTSEPLENVIVYAQEDSTNLQTTTDVKGQYTLSLPPGQPFNIIAVLNGFEKFGPFSLTTLAGETYNLPIILKPLSSATISGQVINDSRVPVPVEGAVVEIEEIKMQTLTDANGDYEITNIPPGNYTLVVKKDCYVEHRESLSLSAGARREVNITLTELKSVIAGKVLDIRGLPIESAKVAAVDVPLTEDKFIDITDSNGDYEICLKGGQYKIVVTHPGYKSKERLLSISEGERKDGINFTLEDNFASITGVVRDTSESPISEVEVILTNANQQLKTITNLEGFYVINQVYPGVSKIRAIKNEFYGKIRTLNISGLEDIKLDLILYPEDGFISGTVRNARDSTEIAGVTITAAFSEDSEQFYTDKTDFYGNYTLSNLPVIPQATFTVDAFKNGYVSQQEAFSDVVVNTSHLDFYLLQPKETIAGLVLDNDTGEPLDSVRVGHSGSTYEVLTKKTGRFELSSLLHSEVYDIYFSKRGFFPDTLRDVAAGDTNVVFKMLRRYAFVSGKISDTTGTAMANVAVHATPALKGRKSVTYSNGAGEYQLKLIADKYEIRPIKISYRNKPTSIQLTLVEESSVTGVDFEMVPQKLQFINITGEAEISNLDQSRCYEATPKDRDGINIVNFRALEWSLNVSPTAARVDGFGCLQISPNYFGELTIAATDSFTGIKGQLDVEVFAPIDSTTETTLFDDRGLQMVIGKRSLPTGINLLVSKRTIAPAKKGRAEFLTPDSSYVIKPVGVTFNGDSDTDLEPLVVNSFIKLILPPPPNTEGQKQYIAKWDEKKSRWFLLATKVNNDNLLEANILETGEYVSLAISKQLTIENVSLLPNPFSPEQEIDGRRGIRIEFDVASNAAPNPLLTVKIYNLEGNLIKILHNQTPFPRGHSRIYWDGKTDNGNLARNGRYIVHLLLEDPAETREEMKSVVLIK